MKKRTSAPAPSRHAAGWPALLASGLVAVALTATGGCVHGRTVVRGTSSIQVLDPIREAPPPASGATIVRSDLAVTYVPGYYSDKDCPAPVYPPGLLAARMRVERALDRLQSVLVRRGITSTTAALTLLLADHAVIAAPSGLAASVSGAALAGAGGTITLWSLMTVSKTLAAISGATTIAIGVGVFRQQQSISRLQTEATELRRQNQEIPALRRENQRLKRVQVSPTELAHIRQARADLIRVRTEVATLQKQVAATTPKPAATPPATWNGKAVYDLRELDVAPRPNKQANPRYPLGLLFDGDVGEVAVRLVVDTGGDVVEATAARATDPAFGEAAVDAVKRWKFIPGRRDGQPVCVQMIVPIVFSIKGDPLAKRP